MDVAARERANFQLMVEDENTVRSLRIVRRQLSGQPAVSRIRKSALEAEVHLCEAFLSILRRARDEKSNDELIEDKDTEPIFRLQVFDVALGNLMDLFRREETVDPAVFRPKHAEVLELASGAVQLIGSSPPLRGTYVTYHDFAAPHVLHADGV
jgi:hypothetical protein